RGIFESQFSSITGAIRDRGGDC
ncbi:MAG: hypothetical protein JWQ73_2784, partial [Variovorax sp.]|nr:hypothetical protein [Variovorax sp.]